MCEPVSTGALILGGVSAASSGVSAFGKHQQAQAQADAQNRAASNNYKYQLKVRERNWDNTRMVWNRKLLQHDQQLDENNMAAARAYSKAQMNLNEQYKATAFKTEGNLAKLIRSQGNFTAAGRTGRSADRLAGEQMMQFGRGQAVLAENLLNAQNNYKYKTMGINRDNLSANRKAYEKVAIQPMPGVAPPQPTMTPGPSGLTLAGDLLGAGISGFNTVDSLTPGGLFGQRVD